MQTGHTNSIPVAESTSVASVVVRLAGEEVGELLLAVSMPKGLLPGRR